MLVEECEMDQWDEDYRKRPNSDSAHVVDFLKTKGYRLGGDVVFKRLVWLDHDKRNELMIIYSEDLGLTEYPVGDLSEAGVPVAKRPEFAQPLHDRAMASFFIV